MDDKGNILSQQWGREIYDLRGYSHGFLVDWAVCKHCQRPVPVIWTSEQAEKRLKVLIARWNDATVIAFEILKLMMPEYFKKRIIHPKLAWPTEQGTPKWKSLQNGDKFGIDRFRRT